nr:hypothetical protein [Lactococcus petauri]
MNIMSDVLIPFGLPIVTGLLSFFGSAYKAKKDYDIRLKEAENNNNELTVKYKELENHLIEQEKTHQHELEVIRLQFENQKSSQQQEMMNEIAGPLAKNILGNMLGDIKSPQDFQKKAKQIDKVFKN